ncbi:MAG: succinate dehydrogenase, hydrophobic membrane anchor protein [Xanthomonadales bacterium]|nr:succinate dehydrogenase, hydrophobic membrane anchor protein [Xanthomonadales bacterium]
MSTHLRDPLANVRGLGSAKSGTHHWWVQRTTAVMLMLLSPWFIYFLVTHIGMSREDLVAAIGTPRNATLMGMFVVAACWHARLGLQVVVEDYIHVKWLEVTLQIAIQFLYGFATLAGLIAIGRMAFTG